MAGIGFQLERLARDGGVGGIASAAVYGTVVSSGPWLLTVGAVLLLQRWTGGMTVIQTILIYAFSASAVIAAPLSIISVRMASDRLFAADRDAVPGVLLAAISLAVVPALLAGNIMFGMIGAQPATVTFLATAIVVLLAQVSIAAPFLTATKRHQPILIGYLAGVGGATLIIRLFDLHDPTALLASIAGGLAVALLLLTATICAEFPASPTWPANWSKDVRRLTPVGFAGLASALAAWIDKWLLWWSPASVGTIGGLRLNSINDQSSFLGLLTIIPGLALMLIVSETRLETSFSNLMARCTGTSKLARIEEGRRDVARTILRDLRLLVLVQAVLAGICWVLAPEIVRLIGFDARGIFAFRLTVVGVIFHVVTIYATTVLSYYDLFGRILAIWTTFVAVSAVATLASWDLGFASFGYGYLAGALAAASLALALLADATIHLTYLLFVGNNPAVVGDLGYWR